MTSEPSPMIPGTTRVAADKRNRTPAAHRAEAILALARAARSMAAKLGDNVADAEAQRAEGWAMQVCSDVAEAKAALEAE